MEDTTPSSVQCSGFLSEEAEDEDSDAAAAPLNLSKRDRNRSGHTADHISDEATDSESNDDVPLDLCLRAQSNNQVQTDATKSSEKVPVKVSIGQVQTSTPTEQEQCDRRHSAAFALCQLASSSNINTIEIPLEPHSETQSPGHQKSPDPDQAPNGDTLGIGKSEQDTAAQGQKRAGDKATKTTSKRVRVNESVRDKRRRTQNC